MNTPASETGTVTVGEFLAGVRRHWLAVAALTVLGCVGAAAFVSTSPLTYTATAAVAVTPIKDDPLATASTRAVSTETEAQVVTSSSVAERAAGTLGWEGTTASLLRHVQVTTPPDSQVLKISFEADTAAEAATGANAMANAYLGYRTDVAQARLDDISTRLQQQIKAFDDTSATSEDRLVDQLREQVSQVQATVLNAGQLVSRAQPPQSPGGASPAAVLLAGTLVGLILGVAAAAWRDRRDPRVHSARDLRAAAGTPVLALPADPQSAADAYASFAVKVTAASGPFYTERLLIAAPRSTEGSEVAVGVARALSATGRDTVLVRLSTSGPTDAPNGVLEGVTPRGAGRLSTVTVDPGAWMDGIEAVSFEAGERGRVVVDAADRTPASSVLAFSGAADAAVVVARRGVTRPAEVTRLLGDLADVGIRVTSAVLLEPQRSSRPHWLGGARSTSARRSEDLPVSSGQSAPSAQDADRRAGHVHGRVLAGASRTTALQAKGRG